MASIKKNIILNGINTITSILFPIVTFPYIARVLEPEGIGIVNFQYSIINVITFLTTLGIPTYAIREIAKFRDNIEERDRIVFEIISFNGMMCILGYIAVFLIAHLVPKINANVTLFYVLSLSIGFTAIGVEWFYNGIEDFKYITIRAIIVRTLSALCLFVFVRSSSDLIIYGLILVGSTVGNNFINFVHLRKFVNIKTLNFKGLRILRHVYPALQMFIIGLIINFYGQLNPVMLGFLSDNTAVGFYTAGTKITYIGIMLITSISPVLLPRCSNLFHKGDVDSFRSVINKSIRLTIAFSLPVMAGLAVLSTSVIIVFCGSEYIASNPVLCVNAPVVLLVGISNVLGIQILFPQNKANIVMLSVAVGAVVNVSLNFILIPRLGATGAALSTTIAELGVLVTQVLAGSKYFPFKWADVKALHYVGATFVMVLVIEILRLFIQKPMPNLFICSFVGVVVYFGVLLMIKDSLTIELFNFVLKKMRLR